MVQDCTFGKGVMESPRNEEFIWETKRVARKHFSYLFELQ